MSLLYSLSFTYKDKIRIILDFSVVIPKDIKHYYNLILTQGINCKKKVTIFNKVIFKNSKGNKIR